MTAAWCGGVAAEERVPVLAPFLVQATHVFDPSEASGSSVDVFTSDDLAVSLSLTLDDVLRQSPSFTLFRRSGSLIANPTAQGVSLRGLGPSGASRALVLLDGVPLNDPFGGWVAWDKLSENSLAQVRIVRGTAASTWGNAALGGTVEIVSQPLAGDRTQFTGFGGNNTTWDADLRTDKTYGTSGIRVTASIFSTDGVPLVADEDRGLIDRPAESKHQSVAVQWRDALSPEVNLSTTARYFSEFRGNGTPLQTNASREMFFSTALNGKSAAVASWSAVVYGQRQTFRSSFSTVSTDRSTETPANDQYDVPATAAGLALTGTWGEARSRTTAGTDVRWVEGETRENFLYSSGRFTRQRIAGGEQAFAGAFMQQDFSLSAAWTVTADLRGDYWWNAQGHRHESVITTGVGVRDDHYLSQEGLQWSPALALTGQLSPSWTLHAGVSHTFRLPTLNEYYRPFRIGAVTTEANPDLGLETNTAGEIAIEATHDGFVFTVTPFVNYLRGAVTNVTVALNQRQRQNLGLVVVEGVESAVAWERSGWQFRVAYMGTDARVVRAATVPALVGNRLPQVPRHTVTARTSWRPGRVVISAQLRWAGEQYEDDENHLPLAAALTGDVGFSYRASATVEFFTDIENIGDVRVETGRSIDGVVNVGAPRSIRAGVRWSR